MAVLGHPVARVGVGWGGMKLEGFVGQIPEGLKASAWGWAASCRLELKGRRK